MKLLDKQVGQLLNGEKVTIPTYNFTLGEKEFREDMQLGENDILIIEGIHALDDRITKNAPRDKIYKMLPSLEIVDQMQKNGQEIDTSDYGNDSSSFEEEEEEDDNDNNEEDSEESDGKDVDSKESEDDYNEENEDDEGGKKKKKK